MVWTGNASESLYPYRIAPLNNMVAGMDESHCCFDGGEWTISRSGETTYRVCIKDYEFDHEKWAFPSENFGQSGVIAYQENELCFSVGFFQAILAFPTGVDNIESLFMSVKIENLTAKSSSGNSVSLEQNYGDNLSRAQITLYPKGSISKYNAFASENGQWLWSVWGAGDARASLNSKFYIKGAIPSTVGLDDDIKCFNILQKFDDGAFEVYVSEDGNAKTYNSTILDGACVALFAAKPDGRGWADDDEMIKTREEDLVYYSSMETLWENNSTCVGVLFEVRGISLYKMDACVRDSREATF